MATTEETIRTGMAHHQAGRIDEAEQAYRQVLESAPRHPAAMHLLGLAALNRGQHDQALRWISQAIDADPTQAAFHANLGEVHRSLGDLSEAVKHYREALRLRADLPEIHNNLGIILQAQGLASEAVACYRAALALRPAYADAHNNLGTVWQDCEAWDQALACYQRSIEIAPKHARGHYNWAKVAAGQGMAEQAEAAYRRALAIDANYDNARLGLAQLLQSQRKFEEALVEYQRFLTAQPDHLDALIGLGTCHHLQKQYPEAREAFERAHQLHPDNLAARYNLGATVQMQHEYARAVELYESVLAIDPEHVRTLSALSGVSMLLKDFAKARKYCAMALQIAPDDPLTHFHLALTALTEGEFQEGFFKYRYSEQLPDVIKRTWTKPLWQGEPLAGRTLLVHTVQGRGDVLQFIRYMPILRSMHPGERIKFEVVLPMMPLLEDSGCTDLVVQMEPPARCDVHVPLMMLPYFCGTTRDTIPAKIPYIFANPMRVDRWQERITQIAGYRVGIHWQGNKEYLWDFHRSFALKCFEPVARVPGVRLISLQKGECQRISAVADRFEVIEFPDMDEEGGAFVDTAAVLKHLDLVITSDSAVAHLAGAMGVPVWLTLSWYSEWRWQHDREDCPWYPTMRLFRQRQPDDWGELFDRVASELTSRVVKSGRLPP